MRAADTAAELVAALGVDVTKIATAGTHYEIAIDYGRAFGADKDGAAFLDTADLHCGTVVDGHRVLTGGHQAADTNAAAVGVDKRARTATGATATDVAGGIGVGSGPAVEQYALGDLHATTRGEIQLGAGRGVFAGAFGGETDHFGSPVNKNVPMGMQEQRSAEVLVVESDQALRADVALRRDQVQVGGRQRSHAEDFGAAQDQVGHLWRDQLEAAGRFAVFQHVQLPAVAGVVA